MSVIALEGMRFHAFHGFYEEEQILGGDYIVDVFITAGFTRAAKEDDLRETINYETVYLVCESAMSQRSRLLENVAERIALGIRFQFRNITALRVRVKKLDPPLGGRVDAAWVELDEQYQKKCARCGKPMICYKDQSCWCMEEKLFDQTLEQLKTHYGDRCLCKECLAFYAG